MLDGVLLTHSSLFQTKDRVMNISRRLFGPISKRVRKPAASPVNDLSFETLDRRIVFDAAGLEMPTLGPVPDAVITEVNQPQASINFPFSPNKTICPITFTTDNSDIGEANSAQINSVQPRSANSTVTNKAFADLSWLSLANTDTTNQDMARADGAAKDKFTTILSEFSEKKEMQTTEHKQIKLIQEMTEEEKERFINIFFHHSKDASNQNLYAARGLHDTTEWSPQVLYKRLK